MSWGKLDATDRRETRMTWALALGKILKGKKLTQTKGPVEATIAALMHLGWKPAAPDLWIVRGPGGETKATIRLDGKTYTRFQITAQAQADAQDILWKSAAKHAHGKGLEGGTPSFEPARRAIRYFRRNGHHEAARALEYVIVGIFKPNATEGKWGICKRCAEVVKLGRKHDLYDCPDNNKILEIFFSIRHPRKYTDGGMRLTRSHAYGCEGCCRDT